jgi:hypothetical protein
MELVDQRAVLDPMILPFLKCYPIPSYEEDVILVAVAEPVYFYINFIFCLLTIF